MGKFDVYVVIGNPGTGKTTTAKTLEAKMGVVSIDRDDIRGELGMSRYDPSDSAHIDTIMWDRVNACVRRSVSVCIGYASAVLPERRDQIYRNLRAISEEVEREIDVVLIECICEPDEAKRRIASRLSDSVSTNNPAHYHILADKAVEIQKDEIDGNGNISFLIFDTQKKALRILNVRDPHLERALSLSESLLL